MWVKYWSKWREGDSKEKNFIWFPNQQNTREDVELYLDELHEYEYNTLDGFRGYSWEYDRPPKRWLEEEMKKAENELKFIAAKIKRLKRDLEEVQR